MPSFLFYDLFPPNFSTACFTAGYCCAASAKVKPATAASQPCLIPLTPLSIPPGCAIMPPPAQYKKSVVLLSLLVSIACPPHYPDDNTGRAACMLPIGVRHPFIDLSAESSDSQNLLRIPLTCS